MPGFDLNADRPRVLVLGNVRSEGLDLLHSFAEVLELPEPVSKAQIINSVKGQDAILHKVGKIGPEALARQDRLRLIARHGVGLDDLDLDAIGARGISVTITPTANSNAVAEATLALMLAALRRIPAGETMLKRDRAWRRETLMGRELRGSCAGVIGYGQIGRRVAQSLAAMGCEVIVHESDPGAAARSAYPIVPLAELLGRADIVTIHCPLTPETRHMIGAEALARMKPSAIVVNTSRGGLVDTGALVAAVTEGRIEGAALDVFETEPPDFVDAVFRCERIVTTPHISAMTLEAQKAMALGAASEIRRVLLEGLQPKNEVVALAARTSELERKES